MVCRENKARSAVMGLTKAIYAADHGGRREPDAVYQSAIHQYGHAFQGVKDPSPQEYQQMLRGLRQQIINDPRFSDADKYRQSHRQPGMVTRIEQELIRQKTGEDENGRKLRPEQLNGGKEFASMQRMSTVLDRGTAARDAYVENYARQTGTDQATALAKWDNLVARPREERENTRIALTDNWRDELAVSGLTSQHQADLMQNNQARDAIAIMEHERKIKVATLPTRPTISDDKRTSFITSEQAKNRVKCEQCGQFGHEESACPNTAEFKAVENSMDRLFTAREKYTEQAMAWNKAVDAGKRHETGDDGTELTGSQLTAKYGADPVALEQARKELKRAEAGQAKARAALEATKGPEPLVSDAVTSMGYDRNTGLLEVTRPGYTRKSDGEQMPDKTYAYRMSNEQHDEMMASGNVGGYLSRTVGSKDNAAYAWENTAEAREATRQRQCPSCGQYASMTSGHQCPVGGTGDSTQEAHWRERQRIAKERVTLERTPAQIGEDTRRRQILAQSHAQLAAGGMARFPEAGQMMATRANGEVGQGPMTVQYLGATVTGKAYTWSDPRTGQAYTTLGSVKCSCGARGACQHREHAGTVVAASYRSQRAENAAPGTSVMRTTDEGSKQRRGTSADAPDGPIQRRTYAKITQDRQDGVAAYRKTWEQYPSRRSFATGPVTSSGTPIPVPGAWSDNKNQTMVDLDDSPTVANRISEELSERTGRSYRCYHRGDGSMMIAPSDHIVLTGKDRSELGRAMGLRGMAGKTGVYVPPENSWRMEMLNRASTGSTDVLGSRMTAGRGYPARAEV